MTVRELKDLCDQCINEHGEDCQVVVMDNTSSDAMNSYSITEGKWDMIPREVTPTKMKTLKVQWNPNSGIKSKPCAYCLRCKNYSKDSVVRHSSAPFRTITCHNPRLEKTLSDVIEYDGSHCMDYDPIEPVYVDEEVIDVPGTYRTENVLLLKTNLNKELK